MTRSVSIGVWVVLGLLSWIGAGATLAAPMIIDHNRTDLTALSLAAVEKAKATLHIAYGHTSHGSQLTTGMTAMNPFINGGGLGMTCPTDTFKWHDGPMTGALDLDDYFVPGDLGNPDRTTWAERTRTYLDNPANSDVNVVIWSWCGQADTSEENIDIYLGLMNQLEIDYDDVKFVYMTGHVNGCAPGGNLLLRNQQIRDYCIANNKILYDFADIESWDPDGIYYGDKRLTDNCDYDSDGNGSQDSNWALDWQNDTVNHTEGVDWFSCSCAHSQALNGNQKAYAAWALWTALADLINPLPGDADSNGVVDEDDALILAKHWREENALWGDGDFNDDGRVDATDASIMAANWGATTAEARPVPEPSTWIALAFMAWIMAHVPWPRLRGHAA